MKESYMRQVAYPDGYRPDDYEQLPRDEVLVILRGRASKHTRRVDPKRLDLQSFRGENAPIELAVEARCQRCDLQVPVDLRRGFWLCDWCAQRKRKRPKKWVSHVEAARRPE